ncbi:hypothetical protein CKALI_10800 [Corynebacterium kalinowskii]|uniref:Rv3660c-like CheY-like N-terminal domain-containing protein n=1 Tax=Corynebacterium kalinowskii TaxID=2675216 RepID=A0A6B8W086_9CORY|nr:septum site-determining protein Ssd [Corynebacterium kalinowskii]QGU03010.1 hypothetical protein CKALI_10800 [Corynebacterium kalinowskii]
MKTSIIVAVGDPLVHPEAMHIAAATGHTVIDVRSAEELRRVAGRGEAVVVDKHMASDIGGALGHPRVLFVAADPGPIDWQRAFKVGASEGFVIPAQAPELLRCLGRAEVLREGPSVSVGVIGAVGGCGASTFAVALARELGEGATLIDADPTSGGLDLLLGAEHALGARWNDLHLTAGEIDPGDLLSALPLDNGLAFLTVPRDQGALLQLTAADVRAAITTLQHKPLVVDLSMRLSDWQEVVSALSAVVVIVPAEIRAVSAARPLVDYLAVHMQGADVLPVVRHRAWSGLSKAEVERLANCEIIAEIPQANSLVKQAEMHGFTSCPRPLRRSVQAVLGAG